MLEEIIHQKGEIHEIRHRHTNHLSHIAVQGVNALTNWTKNLFHGDLGLGGMVKLCVYLIAITLLIKFITKK